MEILLQRGVLSARVETHGGELVSFQGASDEEYIWSGDPAYWEGRNPILFPIVGALKNGKVRIDGKEYAMNRHGFAMEKEFSVVEQGEDFVELELCEDAETLAQYPFRFSLRVRHELTENGFCTRFTVKNPGDGTMPFCIGAHPAFRCPMKHGERFEDYRLVFDEPENAVSILPRADGCLLCAEQGPKLENAAAISLDHAVFDAVDTLIFEGLRSKSVRLVHRDTGRGLCMDFSDFPILAFWTMPGKNAPYICMEPWYGCGAYVDESGDFRDKPHCVALPPRGEFSVAYGVRLI